MILSIDLILLASIIEKKRGCTVRLMSIDLHNVNGDFDVVFQSSNGVERIGLSQKEYYERSRTKKIDNLLNG